MMHERKFTLEDQNIFARLSGDYNKLHVDKIAARRYLFGGQVVHGIHIVLWALDQWLETSPNPVELVSLRVDFDKNLSVGEKVNCRVVSEGNNRIELKIYEEGQICLSISVGWKLPSAQAADNLNTGFPAERNCKVLSSEEVKKASGELALYIDKHTAGELFPQVAKKLPFMQMAQILASTRLVGMECPGFHSIFFALDVKFEGVKGSAPVLKYRVVNFDNRFSLSSIEVQGPSMKGTLKAFLRPPPTQQAGFSDLCKIVTADEFNGQRALIIGGSRGLGELVSKLLAAGGARIILTYVEGKEDAQRVMEEIVSKGGTQADIMYFNVLAPGESQTDHLVNFSPTHLYYFATPPIAANKEGFSVKLFRKFCDYYVGGFSDTLEFILEHAPGLRKIFYPSSVFVEELPVSLGEYACAKAAGEALCLFIGKRKKNILINAPRLPKMATDQTASLMLDDRSDPVETMLKQLRDFKNRS